MVRGGRFGMTRSGSGVVGAFPWKIDVVSATETVSKDTTSFLSHPLPVDPMRVTALRFEGDMGDVGMSVSELPDVDTEELVGTPRNPSSCVITFFDDSEVSPSAFSSSIFVSWIIVTGPSAVVVSGIHDSPHDGS